MFYDYAKVNVKAGDGGNGIVAFRREKYVPKGGPAGGDGGCGGSIILRADEGLRTLVDFRYQTHYKGKRGEHGSGAKQHGRSAEDIVLRVPVGTVVRDADTKKLLGDLRSHGQEIVVAKGGRGGRGNARFVSSTHRAPAFAENGEKGEERWITLELKLLADVGLVGFPNVGKSTIISRISAAKPKIANYHFTTLEPNLGMVRVDAGRSFVVADVPGLVEGAAEGAGLGHRFLRHVERTRVLVHVVDLSGSEGRDPLEDLAVIRGELERYAPQLNEKPMLIIANKVDIMTEEAREATLQRLQDAYPDVKIFPMSAASDPNLDALVYHLADVLDAIGPVEYHEEDFEVVDDEPVKEEAPFRVQKIAPDAYEVVGPEIDGLVGRTQFERDEAIERFMKILDNMGIEKALRAAGIQDGDTVVVGPMAFDYLE
ncbi:MAG: GTPase ObgE [Peptococcaceae bacterium]|nr:GTPase ObgE [Peptococcaceae bacterium]